MTSPTVRMVASDGGTVEWSPIIEMPKVLPLNPPAWAPWTLRSSPPARPSKA